MKERENAVTVLYVCVLSIFFYTVTAVLIQNDNRAPHLESREAVFHCFSLLENTRVTTLRCLGHIRHLVFIRQLGPVRDVQ